MYYDLVKALEDAFKEEKDKGTDVRRGKSLNESNDDVTQMPIIGHVVTLEQGPYLPSTKYDVVQIRKTSAGDTIYVTNQWYKEHRRIPQLVPGAFVKMYTPVVAEAEISDDEDDPSKIEQNKPGPVVFGLG